MNQQQIDDLKQVTDRLQYMVDAARSSTAQHDNKHILSSIKLQLRQIESHIERLAPATQS